VRAAPRDLVHLAPDDIHSLVDDTPRAGGHESRDRLQRRGLAGAIRADKADQLSRFDREVDAFHRADAAVGDVQGLRA
jgi:hypothetical protein